MSTSGTVATTVISTDTLCDHALLRAGKQPAIQTPQVVQQCQESLYMLLLSLANRGLNLWCCERVLSGLVAGQATYQMPPGTLDVLNVIYSQPTLDPAVGVVIPNGMSITPATITIRVGVLFGTAYAGALTVGGYSIASGSYVAGLWYWFDLAVPILSTISVVGTAPDITALRAVTQLRDLPMTPINRDTFMALPNKAQQGHPCVNYWFEKRIPPQNTLWPVPDNNQDHLTLMRHRQIQDVGTLSQQLELPARWLEGIAWQLALRLVFELPDVDPNRIQLVNSMAGQYLMEDELGESDGMPIAIQPRIAPYTR